GKHSIVMTRTKQNVSLLRRTRCSHRPGRAGQNVSAFTLLEILVAVSIFSVVLVAINTVFYAALRLRNKTTEAIEELIPTEHAIAIMKRDFMATLPPAGSLSGQLTTTPTSGGGMGQPG